MPKPFNEDFIVVIDSNAVISDYRMRGNPFKLLLNGAWQGEFTLGVPEVVIREVVRSYGKEAKRALKDVRSALGVVRELNIDVPSIDAVIWHSERDTYENWLRTTLDVAEVLPFPDTPHENLVDRILAERRPANENQESYRDALIWESILAVAHQMPVAFISNDSDFSEGKESRLAESLAKELIDQALSVDRVRLYKTVSSFVKDQTGQALEVLDELNKLSNEPPASEEIQRAIRAAVETDVDKRPVPQWFSSRFDVEGDPNIVWIELPSQAEVVVNDARQLVDDQYVVEFDVTGDASLEFFLPKWEVWEEVDSAPEVLDSDWNDHYALVGVQREATITLEATYRSGAKSLTDLSVAAISIDDVL